MDSFVFFGKILPERSDLTIQNAARSLEKPETNEKIGDIQVDIKNSQVLILLQLNLERTGVSMPADFYTIKNIAYDQTKLFVNLSSLFLGGGYELDITKGFHLGSGRTETFAPRAMPIVEFITNNNKLQITDALKSTYQSTGIFIQYAVEDFSDALRIQSRNAMFLFYRAIESLRNYVGAYYSITADKEQWIKLRDLLDISRDEIDFIKSFADPVRHGGGASWTIQEIERAEKLVWKSIHDVILIHREAS